MSTRPATRGHGARYIWAALLAAVLTFGLTAAPASASPFDRGPVTASMKAPSHSLLGCWGVLSQGQLVFVGGPERIDAIRYALRFKGGKLGSKPSYSIVRTWC